MSRPGSYGCHGLSSLGAAGHCVAGWSDEVTSCDGSVGLGRPGWSDEGMSCDGGVGLGKARRCSAGDAWPVLSSFGVAGRGRARLGRFGPSVLVDGRRGKAVLCRPGFPAQGGSLGVGDSAAGMAMLGTAPARSGKVCLGRPGGLRQVLARQCKARFGSHGIVPLGLLSAVPTGSALRGRRGLGRQGVIRHGRVGWGEARPGRLGCSRVGSSCHSWEGSARQGSAGKARRVADRLGIERAGSASARHGRQAGRGISVLGRSCSGHVWTVRARQASDGKAWKRTAGSGPAGKERCVDLCPATARHHRQGSRVTDSPCPASHSAVWSGRIGDAGRVKSRSGTSRLGATRQGRQQRRGESWLVLTRQCGAWQAWHRPDRLCPARSCGARQARLIPAWFGWSGEAAGRVAGSASFGVAQIGKARIGKAGWASRVCTFRGWSRLVTSGRDTAGIGTAGTDRPDMARPGPVRHHVAGYVRAGKVRVVERGSAGQGVCWAGTVRIVSPSLGWSRDGQARRGRQARHRLIIGRSSRGRPGRAMLGRIGSRALGVAIQARHGSAGLACASFARLVVARLDLARHRSAGRLGCGLLVVRRRGSAGRGRPFTCCFAMHRRCLAGVEGSGRLLIGRARLGRAWQAGIGSVRPVKVLPGQARPGAAWQAGLGRARLGNALHLRGPARLGRAWQAVLCAVFDTWVGPSIPGTARQARVGDAGRGQARRGASRLVGSQQARIGSARHVQARRGLVRQAGIGSAGHASPRCRFGRQASASLQVTVGAAVLGWQGRDRQRVGWSGIPSLGRHGTGRIAAQGDACFCISCMAGEARLGMCSQVEAPVVAAGQRTAGPAAQGKVRPGLVRSGRQDRVSCVTIGQCRRGPARQARIGKSLVVASRCRPARHRPASAWQACAASLVEAVQGESRLCSSPQGRQRAARRGTAWTGSARQACGRKASRGRACEGVVSARQAGPRSSRQGEAVLGLAGPVPTGRSGRGSDGCALHFGARSGVARPVRGPARHCPAGKSRVASLVRVRHEPLGRRGQATHFAAWQGRARLGADRQAGWGKARLCNARLVEAGESALVSFRLGSAAVGLAGGSNNTPRAGREARADRRPGSLIALSGRHEIPRAVFSFPARIGGSGESCLAFAGPPPPIADEGCDARTASRIASAIEATPAVPAGVATAQARIGTPALVTAGRGRLVVDGLKRSGQRAASQGIGRQDRLSPAVLGKASPFAARHVPVRQARLARRGLEQRGVARQSEAGPALSARPRAGMTRRGPAGVGWYGIGPLGSVGLRYARQARHRSVRRGVSGRWQCGASPGVAAAGQAWLREGWLASEGMVGQAWNGPARSGQRSKCRLVWARLGRPGEASSSWQGRSRDRVAGMVAPALQGRSALSMSGVGSARPARPVFCTWGPDQAWQSPAGQAGEASPRQARNGKAVHRAAGLATLVFSKVRHCGAQHGWALRGRQGVH